jgi:hypothetical protein
VRLYGKPARWYRSYADAAEDAADLVDVPWNEPLAVAWASEAETGPVRYLVAGRRGALSWQDMPPSPPRRQSVAVAAMAEGARSRRS